jgi:hypothetical protein
MPFKYLKYAFAHTEFFFSNFTEVTRNYIDFYTYNLIKATNNSNKNNNILAKLYELNPTITLSRRSEEKATGIELKRANTIDFETTNLTLPLTDEDLGPMDKDRREATQKLNAIPPKWLEGKWKRQKQTKLFGSFINEDEEYHYRNTEADKLLEKHGIKGDPLKPYPRPNVRWDFRSGNRAIVYMIKQGLAVTSAESYNRAENKIVVNFRDYDSYKLRDNNYGSFACELTYFPDQNEIKIWTKDHGWSNSKARGSEKLSIHEKNMFVFRNAAVITATVRDHLIHVHLIVSNIGTRAMFYFNHNHPVRKLFKLFNYAAAIVNLKADDTLLAKNGLLFRACGFTQESFSDLLNDTYKSVKYRTFIDEMQSQEAFFTDSSRYYVDGLQYWNLVEKLVREFLGNTYLDYYTTNFFQLMKKEFPLYFASEMDKTVSREWVQKFMTHYIFMVTGYHEHVGSAPEYGQKLGDSALRWIRGETCARPQAFLLKSILTKLTGPRLPGIFTDPPPVFDTRDKVVFRTFTRELLQMENDINERNSSGGQKFVSFHPQFMQQSASI